MTCLFCRSPIIEAKGPRVTLTLEADGKGVNLIFGATACMIAWLRDQGQLPAQLPPPLTLDAALDAAVDTKKEPN